jgi:hypothetical protein
VLQMFFAIFSGCTCTTALKKNLETISLLQLHATCYPCIKPKIVAKAGLTVTADCNYKWICYSYLEGNNLKARDTLDHTFRRIS